MVYNWNDILRPAQLIKQNVNASTFTLKPLKQNLLLSDTDDVWLLTAINWALGKTLLF